MENNKKGTDDSNDALITDYGTNFDSNDDENQHIENQNENDIDTNDVSIKPSINELKKNQYIRYKPKNSTEWKETQLISRGGKATGKFKGCWNTQDSENDSVKCIDFERDIETFEIVDEPNLENIVESLSNSMQALKINVSEVLHNSIKTETEEAIERELKS